MTPTKRIHDRGAIFQDGISVSADFFIKPFLKVLSQYERNGLWGLFSAVSRKALKLFGGTPELQYRQWIKVHETPLAIRPNTPHVERLEYRPLLSVIMPVFNPPVEFLTEAIESVLAQSYPQFELCIADDGSTDPRVRPLLARYASLDDRVRVCFRGENGHISEASNSALSMASGDYVVLFDHDDRLAESALLKVVEALNDSPRARLLYSDEDKLTPAGVRRDPYFKPDWNIDLFYSQNVFSHLGVIERRLMEDVGGFRRGYEGSQDYDLILRCIERISPDAISHIPWVLYHWRVHSESTASGSGAKPYAVTAAERALNDHFNRIGTRANVEAVEAGYRVHYPLPDPLPSVSIILSAPLARTHIRKSLPQLLHTLGGYLGAVDICGLFFEGEASSHAALEKLSAEYSFLNLERLDVREPIPIQLSRLAREVKSEILLFLSPELVPENDQWLSEIVSQLMQPGVGCVGGKILNRWNLIQEAGVVLGMGVQGLFGFPCRGYEANTLGYFGRSALIGSYSAVGPSCLATRSSDFHAMSGFDAEMALDLSLVDYCLRIKRANGKRSVYTPYAILRQSLTPKGRFTGFGGRQKENLKGADLFKSRWAKEIRLDPHYSPNLSLKDHRFGLAFPPRRGRGMDGVAP